MVRQSDAAHYDLLVLCEKLRVARGGKPASAGDASRFDLASRSEQARPALEAPLRTVNFSEGTPLVRIIEFLQDHARVNITVDWQALALAGISREVTGTLAVEGVPFGEALDKLLTPLELDYLIVGPRTLQITSRPAAASQQDLEFYPVRDLLDESTTSEAMLARLTEGLSASAAGAGQPVVVRFDKDSACVLLLAPQAVQREVEGRLTAWRAERSAAAQVPVGATPSGTAATR